MGPCDGHPHILMSQTGCKKTQPSTIMLSFWWQWAFCRWRAVRSMHLALLSLAPAFSRWPWVWMPSMNWIELVINKLYELKPKEVICFRCWIAAPRSNPTFQWPLAHMCFQWFGPKIPGETRTPPGGNSAYIGLWPLALAPERHLWCRLASCPTGNYWSCGPAVNVSENDAYLPALSECQENASQHAFTAWSLLPHLTFFRAVTIYWTRCDAADLDGCRCTCNAGFHPEEPVSQWLWRF